jgi:quercetin dioxygenase-like cupin family protein
MDQVKIVRGQDALRFTTTPTDELRFLVAGGEAEPDIEYETMAPGDGPPLHRHPWSTWSVVVEGEFVVRVDGLDHHLSVGDLAYTPPDAVHSFMCAGDGPGRIVHMNWPGGFHHLYAELSAAFAGDGPPDFGAMAAAATRHGAEILGPPMAMAGPATAG